MHKKAKATEDSVKLKKWQVSFIFQLKKAIAEYFDKNEKEVFVIYKRTSPPVALVIYYRLVIVVIGYKIKRADGLTMVEISQVSGLDHRTDIITFCKRIHSYEMVNNKNYRKDFSVIVRKVLPFMKKEGE